MEARIETLRKRIHTLTPKIPLQEHMDFLDCGNIQLMWRKAIMNRLKVIQQLPSEKAEKELEALEASL